MARPLGCSSLLAVHDQFLNAALTKLYFRYTVFPFLCFLIDWLYFIVRSYSQVESGARIECSLSLTIEGRLKLLPINNFTLFSTTKKQWTYLYLNLLGRCLLLLPKHVNSLYTVI